MRVRYQVLLFLIISVCVLMLVTAYSEREQLEVIASPVPFLKQSSEWVDSTMAEMSLEEKVGQLLIIKAAPHNDSLHNNDTIAQWAQRYRLGGIVFEKYGLDEQYKSSLQYQAVSEVPLLIGMYNNSFDERFVQFPNEWTMASIQEDSLILSFGSKIADQGTDLGIQIYLPPHKQQRSSTLGRFLTVASRIQKNKILACGQLGLDEIPQISNTSFWNNYKLLAESGAISALYVKPEVIVQNSEMSLANKAEFKNLLRNNIGFEGLIISELYDSLETTLFLSQLVHGGADMVMVSGEADQAIETLVKLVRGNFLLESEINEKVRRVLMAKSWSNAREQHRIAKLDQDRQPTYESPAVLNHQLAQAAITLVKDNPNIIPYDKIGDRKFHVLHVGSQIPDLLKQLKLYTKFSMQSLAIDPEKGILPAEVGRIGKKNSLIAVINHLDLDFVNHEAFLEQLASLQADRELVVINLGYLNNLKHLAEFPTILQAYSESSLTQKISMQVLFGGLEARGGLPVNIEKTFAVGTGIKTRASRLSYVPAEMTQISSIDLSQIDTLVREGLDEYAMPGCQVLVAKKGKIIYHKSFGYHTYSRRQKVQLTDLYDLASITKVAGTTLASMKLYESGSLGLDKMLKDYLSDNKLNLDSIKRKDVRYRTDTMSITAYQERYGEEIGEAGLGTLRGMDELETVRERVTKVRYQDSLVIVFKPSVYTISEDANIFNISIRELLTHHSGINRSLPIRDYTSSRRQRRMTFGDYFDRIQHEDYSIQVAGNFYFKKEYQDSLWRETKYLRINESKNYLYSDVNMVLVQRVIDSLNQMPMDQFLIDEIYKPLGLQTARFNPRKGVLARRIVPTEYDMRWRKQLIRGYVHDPTAALMGGVAGSAGLFSNANDIAIIFQMLLNGGEYGGKKFFDKKTIELFTKRQLGHRGLGFDKPPLKGKYMIASQASPSSYGHTGFTGTCVWADPEHDLIYVFLSNRIHPTPSNKKLSQLRIRERIHDAIYDAIYASEAEQGMEGQYSHSLTR